MIRQITRVTFQDRRDLVAYFDMCFGGWMQIVFIIESAVTDRIAVDRFGVHHINDMTVICRKGGVFRKLLLDQVAEIAKRITVCLTEVVITSGVDGIIGIIVSDKAGVEGQKIIKLTIRVICTDLRENSFHISKESVDRIVGIPVVDTQSYDDDIRV